ncbi:MAG: hypothetical protein ACJA2M_002992 [Polaribacter sp.]|jgi:hypothetical protein
MKVDEALIIFYKLKNNTEDKTESKIYAKFITILLDLQQRDFNSNQKKDLETKLLSLNLKNNLYPTKKNLNKELTSFEYFLSDKFSIISENHYVSKGMALWLFSSIILFYSFGQFSVIGALLVAIIFGVILDLEAKAQGRVIKMANNRQEPFFIKKPIVLNDFSKEEVVLVVEQEEEEEEEPKEDSRKELQNYRKQKLQQFGKQQGQIKEPNKEEYEN